MGFQHKTYKPCGATCKRTGQACQNPAIVGRGRCRLHGGKTPRGAAASQFNHGFYSKSQRVKTFWKAIERNYQYNLREGQAASFLEANPMPRGIDYKSDRAYIRALKQWRGAYLAALRAVMGETINPSEAEGIYQSYCDELGTTDFDRLYMFAVWGVR